MIRIKKYTDRAEYFSMSSLVEIIRLVFLCSTIRVTYATLECRAIFLNI